MYLTHTSLLRDLQAIFHGRSLFLSEMRHDLLITAKVCLNLGTEGEVMASSGSTPMTSAVVHLKRAHLRQRVLYGIVFYFLNLLHQVDTCSLDSI